MSFELIPTSKGKSKLIANGYTYVFDGFSADQKLRFWRCDQFVKNSCRTRIHTEADQIIKEFHGHSHPPDHERIEALKQISYLKERARCSQESPKDLLDSVLATVDTPTTLPTYSALKRMVERVKKDEARNKPPSHDVCFKVETDTFGRTEKTEHNQSADALLQQVLQRPPAQAKAPQSIGKGCKALLRKARELSEQCNVDVCVVVVPKQGTVWKYATSGQCDPILQSIQGRVCRDIVDNTVTQTSKIPQESSFAGFGENVGEDAIIDEAHGSMGEAHGSMGEAHGSMGEAHGSMGEAHGSMGEGMGGTAIVMPHAHEQTMPLNAFQRNNYTTDVVSSTANNSLSETPWMYPFHDRNDHNQQDSVSYSHDSVGDTTSDKDITQLHIKQETLEENDVIDSIQHVVSQPSTSQLTPTTQPQVETNDLLMRKNLVAKVREYSDLSGSEVAIFIVPRDKDQPVMRYAYPNNVEHVLNMCKGRRYEDVTLPHHNLGLPLKRPRVD